MASPEVKLFAALIILIDDAAPGSGELYCVSNDSAENSLQIER
jgi:hypothetical protein